MNQTQKKDLIEKAAHLYEEVFKFAFRKIKDREAAQDIAQTVMKISIAKIHNLRDPEALKSWIKQITANQIKEYFRQLEAYRKNMVTVTPAEEQALMEQLCDEEADILQRIEEEEARHNIIKALLRLEPKYQEILRDHLVYEIPLNQVAEKRNINYNTVRTRYQRGLQQLKEEFDRLEKGR